MNRLKELRKTAGLTQMQISDKLNVSVKTYRTWEISKPDGSTVPLNSENLEKLSKIYSVSTDYILGLSDYTSDYNNLIGEQTGLTNKAIDNLIRLNKHWKATNISILNYIMSDYSTFCEFLNYLNYYFDNEYTIPLYRDNNHQFKECNNPLNGIALGKKVLDNAGNQGFEIYSDSVENFVSSYAMYNINRIINQWRDSYI